MTLLLPMMSASPKLRPDPTRALADALGGSGTAVLDVSCGNGSLARLLLDLGHWVTGVDPSPRRVARLRARAERSDWPAEFVAGDPDRLPLPDDTFDAVVARHLLARLEVPHRALDEWLRVLRPGGTLLLIDAYPAAHRGWLASGSALGAPRFAVQEGAPFREGLRPSEAQQLAGLADVAHLGYYDLGRPNYLVTGRKP